MLGLFALIMFCTIIAYKIQIRTGGFQTVRIELHRNPQIKFMYVLIIFIVTLFSGLRTTYNDTSTYIYAYTLLDKNDIRINELLEPYGGFEIYQKLIKHYVSENPQALLIITAVILNVIFIGFIGKYSVQFAQSIYLYLTGLYIFGMAGMKQALAIAFSLFAIENMLRRRYIRALLWLAFACTFHPYIICLIILPLLKKKAWDKKTAIILLFVIICLSNLDTFLALTSTVGKDYTVEEITSSTVNPMRVLVESMPIIISFMARRRINESQNELLILGVNMSIIRFFFIAIGLFMNPIYFARVGTYFSSVSAVIVPLTLMYAFQDLKESRICYLGYYFLYTVYFILDTTKLGSIGVFTDLFHHISIL